MSTSWDNAPFKSPPLCNGIDHGCALGGDRNLFVGKINISAGEISVNLLGPQESPLLIQQESV